MRRRGLLQPVNYQTERRQLARARREAFVDPPTHRNQVWQLDFLEYETLAGGIWRIAGCADYFAKHEFGWRISPTQNRYDAIAAVELAIDEAEHPDAIIVVRAPRPSCAAAAPRGSTWAGSATTPARLVERVGARHRCDRCLKARLGAPEVARVLLDAGVPSIGDARIENLESLRLAGIDARSC